MDVVSADEPFLVLNSCGDNRMEGFQGVHRQVWSWNRWQTVVPLPPEMHSLCGFVSHVCLLQITDVMDTGQWCWSLSYPTAPLHDPLQYYRSNRSIYDAVNLALHFTLQHLNSPGTYARFLFVDFSSVFNTILPHLLQDKLHQLNHSLWWSTDFLMEWRLTISTLAEFMYLL